GNLLRLEDWLAVDVWGNPQVQTFAYDERHRLTGASASGGDAQGSYSESAGYDPLTGRLSHKAGLDYTYEAGQPHAVRRVTGRGGSNQSVTIRARGTAAYGAWPIMKLYVNGQERATWTVSSSSYTDYTIMAPLSGDDQLEVVVTNDAWQDADHDRNLFIDVVVVDGRPVQAEGGAALIDRALRGGTAFDGQDLLPGGEGLYWTSALRFVVGAAAFAGGDDATGTLTSRPVDEAAQLLRYDAEQRLMVWET
ncbi:MAG TPA: hypothetical protein DEP84_11700, partial [Chloroflexi bacterium]|nr:hypothetical protein [Chloroflexota bacterium]